MSEPMLRRPKQLLVHIGAPKTATTSLQAWLRGNRERLERRGIAVFLPRQVRQKSYLGPFTRYLRGKSDDPGARAFLALFGETDSDAVIVSEEALTNDFIPGFNDSVLGFEMIDRTIAFLQALEIEDLRILLTVRRQDTFLKSAYSHRVRRAGITLGFDAWLDQEVKIAHMSWLTVVDKLDAAFGADKVTVVPFEMLKTQSDKDFYLRTVGTAMDRDFERHEAPKKVNENSALAVEVFEIAAILNALPITNEAQIDRRRKLLNEINAFVLDNGGQRFEVDLTEVTAQCRALYAAENAALAARKFPDLVTGFTFEA